MPPPPSPGEGGTDEVDPVAAVLEKFAVNSMSTGYS
jgi:hypothetical protein